MDEFLNNNGENEEVTEQNAGNEVEAETEPEISNAEETANSDGSGFNEEIKNQPVYMPVNYSEIKPISDYKPMSKGLKVFALITALVLLLTGSCVTGYFFGKNGTSQISKTKATIKFVEKSKDEKAKSANEIYDNVQKSVVGITVYNTAGYANQASGVVISKDGYIVTNDHIYDGITLAKFKIYTYDGKEYDAKFVSGDKVSDLAVLKVDSAELKPAEFASSDGIGFGQDVLALGRQGEAIDKTSITNGIVSATSRRVTTTSSYSARLIVTTCNVNSGGSGGALVNLYGQVIGLLSSGIADSEQQENVGYAIPTTTVKRITDELIAKGKVVSRAKLGISYNMIDSVAAEIKGVDYTGLYIASVSEDSDLYGNVEEGNVITEINGEKITNDDIVLDILENCRAGDKVTLTILNGTKTKTYEVVLKANVSESSYSTENAESGSNNNNADGGGIFNFPDGE